MVLKKRDITRLTIIAEAGVNHNGEVNLEEQPTVKVILVH